MAIVKSEKYVWNAATNQWDLYYDKTSADNVVETEFKKVLTSSERTKIIDYLSTFNAADKLVLLNESGKIPDGLVNANFTDFVKRDGTLSMTGDLNMGSKVVKSVKYVGFAEYGVSIDTDTGGYLNLTAPEAVRVDSKFDFRGNSAIGVADPIDAQDAANKRWVEQLVSQGTHVIGAVRAATTGNVASVSGTVTIDGVVLVAGDRVLVKEQTTSSQNGVYIVNSGAWTKIPNDSDKGSLVSVLEGTTQRRHQYYNQNGTTWVKYWVDDNYYAAENGGLELSADGFGFGIKSGSVTNSMLSGSINVANKLANFEIPNSWYEDYEWGHATTGISTSLINALGHFAGMIKTLRGTTTPHENNAETIAGAYGKIALKNSIKYGLTVPSGNSGGVNGDVFLKELSRTL